MYYIKPTLTPRVFKQKNYHHVNSLINLDRVMKIGLATESTYKIDMFYYSITFDQQTWVYENEDYRDTEYAQIEALVMEGGDSK